MHHFFGEYLKIPSSLIIHMTIQSFVKFSTKICQTVPNGFNTSQSEVERREIAEGVGKIMSRFIHKWEGMCLRSPYPYWSRNTVLCKAGVQMYADIASEESVLNFVFQFHFLNRQHFKENFRRSFLVASTSPYMKLFILFSRLHLRTSR